MFFPTQNKLPQICNQLKDIFLPQILTCAAVTMLWLHWHYDVVKKKENIF